MRKNQQVSSASEGEVTGLRHLCDRKNQVIQDLNTQNKKLQIQLAENQLELQEKEDFNSQLADRVTELGIKNTELYLRVEQLERELKASRNQKTTSKPVAKPPKMFQPKNQEETFPTLNSVIQQGTFKKRRDNKSKDSYARKLAQPTTPGSPS